MDIKQEVLSAKDRIRPYLRQTYLEFSPYLSRAGNAQVFLKLENLQHTGSFKARGAMNKLLSLTPEQRARGCITASTGNHGAAVAFGLSLLDAKGVVFVPENASPTKLAAIRQLGGEVRFHGLDGAVTESFARAYAQEHGMVYISPYNDLQVLAGQGTVGLELLEQLPALDAVFVSLGGGGLISGIGGYLKAFNKATKVIACSPVNSQVMAESVRAGRILELESLPTLSDGTAGGVEAGAITFDLCRKYVDAYVSVSEEEIVQSLRGFMGNHHMMAEGAAGVALAAYRQRRAEFQGKHVAIVICGANIGLDALKSVLI